MDKLKCFTCKQEKPLNSDNFYRAAAKRFGFQEECKECKNKRDKVYRSTSEKAKRYSTSPRFVFGQLMHQAKKRGIRFELTYEHYLENLAKKPCYICKSENTKHWVDRIINDNSIGYTKENSAPCCELCNKMKSHRSKDDFIAHCKRVAETNK